MQNIIPIFSMETNTNQPQSEQKPDAGFTTKKVETPLFDSGLRMRLATGNEPSLSGGGFYANNKFFIWAGVFAVLLIAVLAFFAFRKRPVVKPAEAKVNVEISAPETVPSGADVVYKITVQNQDPNKLVGMKLEVTYPDGFAFVSSSPPPDVLTGTSFTVPDLVSGQNATMFVKARASGNLNDTKELSATLHYRYSDFNSGFTKKTTFAVRLSAASIAMELSGPQTTNNAQLVIYTLTYKNNSDNSVQNARVTFTYPAGFKFAASEPQPDIGNNIWNVGTLDKGKDGTISVQGTYGDTSPGEQKTMTAALSVLGGNGQYFDQASASYSTGISSTPLLVSQQYNGSGQIANPGDRMSFTIKYQNNATTPARGVNVSVTLDSKAIDLSSIQAEGAQINNSTITWNAASVSALESLRPGEGGQLSFSVQVNRPAVKDSSTNLTAVSHVKIKSNEYDTFFPGNDLTVKISSPFDFSSQLAYVSGSMPPRVGKDTVYKVTLQLKNSTNNYASTMVTAFIPLGAGGFDQGSVGASEAGKVNFDPSTGKLTWDAGILAAGAGKFLPARQLTFNVRLNPSSVQSGQSPVLVKNIQMTATDSFTNKDVKASLDDVSISDIPNNDGSRVEQ